MFGGNAAAAQAGLDAAPGGCQHRAVKAETLVDSREIALADADATVALGLRLGARLARGETVCLYGNLGAGKTTLARGVIAAWTGEQVDVPSPSYTLVQGYEGERGELWHVDLYRLERAYEAWELGLEEAFVTAACIVEWPERLEGTLPQDRLDVEITPRNGGRAAHLTAHGAWRTKLATI